MSQLLSRESQRTAIERDRWLNQTSSRTGFEVPRERPSSIEDRWISDPRRRDNSPNRVNNPKPPRDRRTGRERAKSMEGSWVERERRRERDTDLQENERRMSRDSEWVGYSRRPPSSERDYYYAVEQPKRTFETTDFRVRGSLIEGGRNPQDRIPPSRETSLHERVRQLQRESEWEQRSKRYSSSQEYDYSEVKRPLSRVTRESSPESDSEQRDSMHTLSRRASRDNLRESDSDIREKRPASRGDRSDNSFYSRPQNTGFNNNDFWSTPSSSPKSYSLSHQRSATSSSISTQPCLTPIQEIENPVNLPTIQDANSPLHSPVHEVDIPDSLRAILEYKPQPFQSLESTFAEIAEQIQKSERSKLDSEGVTAAAANDDGGGGGNDDDDDDGSLSGEIDDNKTITAPPSALNIRITPPTRIMSVVTEKSSPGSLPKSLGKDHFLSPLPFLGTTQEMRLLLATLLARLNNNDVDVSLLYQLIRFSKETNLSLGETSVDIWENGDRYGELLHALLAFMDDPNQQNSELRETILRLIQQLFINQTEYLKGYEKSVLRVLLECRADPVSNVCAQAEEVLETFVELVDTQIGLYVLIDIMESSIDLEGAFGLPPSPTKQSTRPRSGSNPKKSAFLCMYKLIKRFDKNSLTRQMGKVLPLAIRGFNDSKPEIRKSVVDALVLIHSVLGDDRTMFQYLRTLSRDKQQLLHYYFDKSRKRQQRAPAELKVEV